MQKLFSVLKVILAEFVCSVLLLMVVAFIMYSMGMRDNLAKILVYVVYFVATFVGGFLIGKIMRSKRIVWGIAMGILYFSILIGTSLLMHSGIKQEMNMIWGMLCCILGGSLGGFLS